MNTADHVVTVLSRLRNVGQKGTAQWQASCPGHDDEDPGRHLSVGVGPDGRILLHCFRGCEVRAIVAAIRLSVRDLFAPKPSALGAVRRPWRSAAPYPPSRILPRAAQTRSEPILPVPDLKRMAPFVQWAHNQLMCRPELQEKWLKHRGLSIEVATRYQLVFVERCRSNGREVRDAWTIPIPDPDGHLRAVKLHRENPPPNVKKGSWATFGTRPDPGNDHPRHGWSTLFPWPNSDTALAWAERAAIAEHNGRLSPGAAEALADHDVPVDSAWLYVCPGELKALAVLSAGRAATGITGGENFRWTPYLVAPFRRHRVVILYDDDETGHTFRDATIAALWGVAAEIKVFTFGRLQA